MIEFLRECFYIRFVINKNNNHKYFIKMKNILFVLVSLISILCVSCKENKNGYIITYNPSTTYANSKLGNIDIGQNFEVERIGVIDDNEINKLISNEQMIHQNSIKFSVKSLNDSDDEDFKEIMSDVESSFENEKKYLIVISEKYNDVTDNDLYDIINNPDKYLDFAKLYTIY